MFDKIQWNILLGNKINEEHQIELYNCKFNTLTPNSNDTNMI